MPRRAKESLHSLVFSFLGIWIYLHESVQSFVTTFKLLLFKKWNLTGFAAADFRRNMLIKIFIVRNLATTALKILETKYSKEAILRHGL